MKSIVVLLGVSALLFSGCSLKLGECAESESMHQNRAVGVYEEQRVYYEPIIIRQQPLYNGRYLGY